MGCVGKFKSEQFFFPYCYRIVCSCFTKVLYFSVSTESQDPFQTFAYLCNKDMAEMLLEEYQPACFVL